MTVDDHDIKSRPTVAKGNRPIPLGDPHIDRVLSVTIAVAIEVSVLHDRLDTLERIASEKNRFSLDDLNNYEVSDDVELKREQWRQDFIQRILRIMTDGTDAKSIEEQNRAYQVLVKNLAE